jgi:hypothetical protein
MAKDDIDADIDEIGRNGPKEKTHIMFFDYASNAQIVLAVGYLVALMAWVSYHGYQVFSEVSALPADSPVRTRFEPLMLQLTFLAGMFGGLLQTAVSLGKYVGIRKFLRSWLTFYFLRPFVGAGLGVLVYFVLHTGVMSPAGATAGQFNIFGIVTFSALSGLFSRQAMDKLAEVFDSLFALVKQEISEKKASDILLVSTTREQLSTRLPPSLPPAKEKFGMEEVAP